SRQYQPHVPVPLVLLMTALALAQAALPARVFAWCGIIPPAEQAFPSTLGSVTAPVSTAGRTVEIRLGPCDASSGFALTPSANKVPPRSPPPGGPPTTVNVTSGLEVPPGDCAVGGPCNVLRFTVPSTFGDLPPDGLAGPAQILVENPPGTVVAQID